MLFASRVFLRYNESMWKDIYGHTQQVELLKSYSASDRIPHAFLFYGPAGTGKTRVAREFFMAVNCLEHRGDACKRCKSCLKVIAGGHPDLVELNPLARWIKVDEMRDVLAEVGFKPFESRMKFVIIEPAESLNRESSNALLKTLEEPPPNTLIVLVSHRPKLLLPTILSRCQAVRLNRRDMVIPEAAGRPGMSSNNEDIAEMRSRIVGLMAGEDPAFLAKEMYDKGEGWDTVADMLAIVESIMRDAMALQHGVNSLVNPGMKEIPLRHVNHREMDEMARLISAIRSGVNENINMKAAATELFYKVSQLANR
jgi:DNA polymerase III delta' subunit